MYSIESTLIAFKFVLQTENNFNIVTHFEKTNLVIHLKWLNIWNGNTFWLTQKEMAILF